MLDIIIVIGLLIDVVAALMMYYGKIFRSSQTIEQISKHSEHEIKHRILETQLARLGAILLIVGFVIQIIGYTINIKV
ncbi:hypothetical protein [Candidatus Nitrosocosmicus hydrocola]|uniref:hypothetical protein n=1 Tax=Candidatus Nitrosocosmicus hydrocola TaxID=1826872 RepID=UPI0011E5D9B7|nr:hypothetical protein [Candidatus Nitrosocosmicus hydrocola]